MQTLYDSDEQTLLSCKPELKEVFWYNVIFIFWRYFLILTCALIYLDFHQYNTPDYSGHISILQLTLCCLALLAIASVGYNLLYVRNMEYIITNKKIYLRLGVLNISKKILLYRSIADFDLQQNILQRFFNLGSLNIDEYAGNNTNRHQIIGLTMEKLEAIVKIINDNMQQQKNLNN